MLSIQPSHQPEVATGDFFVRGPVAESIIDHADDGALVHCYFVCKDWNKHVTERVLNRIEQLIEKIVRLASSTTFSSENVRNDPMGLIILNRRHITVEMLEPVRKYLDNPKGSRTRRVFFTNALFQENLRLSIDIRRLAIEKKSFRWIELISETALKLQ